MQNILLAVCLVAASALAQQDHRAGKSYEGEGRLVIFRIVPGDKSAKLYLVGKKAADLDFRKDVRLLSITATKPGGSREELRFEESGDSYLVTPFPESHDLTFEVKAETRGKKENIRLKGRP